MGNEPTSYRGLLRILYGQRGPVAWQTLMLLSACGGGDYGMAQVVGELGISQGAHMKSYSARIVDGKLIYFRTWSNGKVWKISVASPEWFDSKAQEDGCEVVSTLYHQPTPSELDQHVRDNAGMLHTEKGKAQSRLRA